VLIPSVLRHQIEILIVNQCIFPARQGDSLHATSSLLCSYRSHSSRSASLVAYERLPSNRSFATRSRRLISDLSIRSTNRSVLVMGVCAFICWLLCMSSVCITVMSLSYNVHH